MDVGCPHCLARFNISPSKAGEVLECQICKGKFQVPVPSAQLARIPYGAGFATTPEGQAFASKKIPAGIVAIFFGGFGIHKFILGQTGAGIIMLSVWLIGMFLGMCLLVPILLSLAMQVIGIIEGVIYLSKSDEDFYQTYGLRRKEWF